MTAFSLRLTNGANAVSQLHAETANATWQRHHRPRDPGHHQRHPRPDLGRRSRSPSCSRTSAPTSTTSTPSTAAGPVLGAPRARSRRDDLWEAHLRQKRELALFARGRLRSQFARHGEAPSVLAELETALDPDVLTIGFARRFATYKRAGLLFSDIDRLARMLWDEERPVQVVFAGKAHPADRPGQRVIQEIFQRSRSPQLRGRVFILEDYDMRVARFLVQGVDVWLNNPRRPLEASGTSGMKAAQNGVPNVSVLDGWWDEGYDGRQRLGDRRPRDRTPTRRPRTGADAQDLYRLLEEEIVPRYYERDAHGLPPRWLDVMRRSMATRALALLDDADAPRVHRAAVPAGGRRRRSSSAEPRRPSPKPAERRVAPRISLALALHNHQPVGNFGWVFAEVYEQAYLPMVEALERHPGVRLSLHYTGPAARLAARRAARLHRPARARSSTRDQVEILGGGYYEPVLASLPERDRIGQLRPDGRRARGAVRAAAARRVAGRAGLGAGPADVAGRRPATTGRSSTTPTSAPRRSPRRTSGARTRPTTRASSCASSGPSRACATGSRSATSTRSSTTCASTPPRTASGSG